MLLLILLFFARSVFSAALLMGTALALVMPTVVLGAFPMTGIHAGIILMGLILFVLFSARPLGMIGLASRSTILRVIVITVARFTGGFMFFPPVALTVTVPTAVGTVSPIILFVP